MIVVRVNAGNIAYNKETKSNEPPIMVQENGEEKYYNNIEIVGDSKLISNEDKTKVWIECKEIRIIN